MVTILTIRTMVTLVTNMIVNVCVGLHKKMYYFCRTLIKIWIFRQILVKVVSIEFHENPSCGSPAVKCGQTYMKLFAIALRTRQMNSLSVCRFVSQTITFSKSITEPVWPEGEPLRFIPVQAFWRYHSAITGQRHDAALSETCAVSVGCRMEQWVFCWQLWVWWDLILVDKLHCHK